MYAVWHRGLFKSASGCQQIIKVKNWKITQNSILCIQIFFHYVHSNCLVCCDGKSQEDVEQVQTVGT